MNLRFESTKKFEKELDGFSAKDKKQIIQKLNKYSQLLESEPENFYKKAYQPMKLKLKGDSESSLYALKINLDIRLIITVDEDPLFDQTIITLLHAVRHSSIDKAFKSIAESLYQKELNSIRDGSDK